MDYVITEVSNILDHPNADRLQIAVVSGWHCIIGKDTIKPGDRVLYIAPDAQIVNPDEEWCSSFRSYLGKNGRVKTAKLRGVYSEGIVIENPDIIDMIDGSEEKYIKHFEMPIPPQLAGQMRAFGLPYHLPKTDQENVQNLNPSEYLGKNYFITRKMDGSSCTVTYEPSTGETHICSRRVDFKLDSDDNKSNVFIVAATPLVEWLKTKTNPTDEGLFIIRGEVCGQNINANKANKDCVGEPTLNIFEFRYYTDRNNLSDYTSSIYYNSELIAATNTAESKFKVVPLVRIQYNLTQDIVEEYLNAPASDGEGVVLWEFTDDKINYPKLTGKSFKIKSKDYDAKL
jgi:RNA ligase (TIGR02306 family)